MDSDAPAAMINTLEEDRFWETVDYQFWAPITTEDVQFVRELLTENSGYIDAVPTDTVTSTEYVLGKPAAPPPLSVTSACDQTTDLDRILAKRGSIDEVMQGELRALLAACRDAERQKYDRRQRRKGAAVAVTGLSDDADAAVGMVDEICDLYSLNPPCDPQEMGEGRGTAVVQPDCTDHPVHVLAGKRGRRYDEVWAEEDYCNNNESIGADAIRPVVQWGELINHYSDAHDLPYISWLCSEKQKGSDPPSKKPRTGGGLSSPVAVDLPVMSVPAGPTSLPAPPVPVSCHHPACWGPGWRRGLKEHSMWLSSGHSVINSSIVHPASVSHVPVPPPGRGDHSLLDEIDIIAAVASARLKSVAEMNARRLVNILPRLQTVYSLLSLNTWKQKLQNCLDSVVGDVMIPLSDRVRLPAQSASGPVVSYLNLIPVPEYTRTVDSDEDTEKSKNNGCSNMPPSSNGSVDKSVWKSECTDPGADVGLAVGQVVELLASINVGILADPAWILATVVRLYCDGNITRYVKVRPLGSSSAENLVVAVDDHRIAIAGTNIPKQAVRLLLKDSSK